MEMTPLYPLHGRPDGPCEVGFPHAGGLVPLRQELQVADEVDLCAIDLWPHPLTDDGRRWVVCHPGTTLMDLMADELPPWQMAVACINGRIVARPLWDSEVLLPDDIVQVRAITQRGALRALLAVVILVAASYFGPALAGAFGITSAAGIAAVTAGLGIVGMLLLNVLFPPRLPDVGTGASQPSPQYTLTGGSNRARPHEPLQVLLGIHRLFPDLVSQAYVEFGDNNEQYLNQLFDFGIGNVAIDNIRLGETLLSSYQDHNEQMDVDKITLVHENVDSVAGGVFARDNLTITRSTAEGTTRVGWDLTSLHYRLSNKGKVQGGTVTFALRYRTLGTNNWTRVDQVLTSPDGGEGRNFVRKTVTTGILTSGKYEVQCVLTHLGSHALSTDLDAGWPEDDERLTVKASVNFKAYQDTAADFTGRNPLALRIKATGQLSGRIQTLNADGAQLIPSWDGGAWIADSRTSNPGDILLQHFRGWRIGGVLRFGYGLPDDLINLGKIQDFVVHCRTNDLECNLVLMDDRDDDHIAALIAQCGWGRVDISGGKYSVIWEEDSRPVTALVNPANMVAGSINISYDNQNLADEIIGTYLDRDSGYQENELRRSVPNNTITGEFPVVIKLEGITSGSSAAREINRAAAANFYHRRAINWDMTEEGFAGIGIGDVVGMANGLVDSQLGGRLLAISANRRTVTPAFENTHDDGMAWVWLLDGTILFTTFTRSGSDVVLANPIPGAPSNVDEHPVDYRINLFPTDAPYVKVRVTAIRPSGEGRYRFTARDELAQYYTFRHSDLTAPLIPIRANPQSEPVSGFVVTATDGGVRVFSWAPHPLAIGYEIRYSATLDARFSAMLSLHEGMLTDSPWNVWDRPAEGEWRFGIAGILPNGLLTQPAYTTATLPEAAVLSDAFGFEYIFAAAEGTIPSNQLPSNDWGFEMPGTSGGLVWMDDAPPSLSPSTPYLWRCQRKAKSGLEVGDPVDDAWGEPKMVGGEGGGYEEIFVRTANASIPTNQLPLQSWLYEQPQTRNGLTWTDDAQDVTQALPYLWRARRRVAGYPSSGTTIPSSWGQAKILSRYGDSGEDGDRGIDGLQGDDGAGVEYVFARTSSSGTPSTNQRPMSSWLYDAGGTRNGLLWTDGAPNLSTSLSYLWRCERPVQGSPSPGDAVGTSWSTPAVVGRWGPQGIRGVPGDDFALTDGAITTVLIAEGAVTEEAFSRIIGRELTTTLSELAAFTRTLVTGETMVCKIYVNVVFQGTNGVTLQARRGTTVVETYTKQSDESRDFYPNLIVTATGPGSQTISLWGKSKNLTGAHRIVYGYLEITRLKR